jgi:hypothetical protein
MRLLGIVLTHYVKQTAVSIDSDFDNQFLATTVGLELVASKRPQKWLVMDQLTAYESNPAAPK